MLDDIRVESAISQLYDLLKEYPKVSKASAVRLFKALLIENGLGNNDTGNTA
jgi:hypothetical protein